MSKLRLDNFGILKSNNQGKTVKSMSNFVVMKIKNNNLYQVQSCKIKLNLKKKLF